MRRQKMIRAVSSHGGFSGKGSSVAANRWMSACSCWSTKAHYWSSPFCPFRGGERTLRCSNVKKRRRRRTLHTTQMQDNTSGGLTIAFHREAAVGRGGISCYLRGPFWGIFFIGQLRGNTSFQNTDGWGSVMFSMWLTAGIIKLTQACVRVF